MGGVEKFVGEGDALLGADFHALAALDALGDEEAYFFGGGEGFDGVGRAYFEAEVAANAGFPGVGDFAAQAGGGGDGRVQGGGALADVLQEAGDGGGELGGGEGVGAGLLE